MASKEIKSKVSELVKKHGIKTVDYDSLSTVAEKSGYTVVEFSAYNEGDVKELIEALGLEDRVRQSRGFTYASSEHRLIFVNEDLSEDEKTIVLAHELGHVKLGHLQTAPIIGKDVTDEYEANEFAQELINTPKSIAGLSKKTWLIIAAVAAAVVIIAIVLLSTSSSKSVDTSQASSTTIASNSTVNFEQTDTYKDIEKLTKESFANQKTSVEYDSENKIIKILITAPTGTAVALTSKYSEVKSYWEDMCTQMCKYSKSVYDVCQEAGYSVGCAVLIVSDVNSDNCLYAALNGSETYNVK